MPTMAEVKAGALSDDIKRAVIADQFASDWLLVAENDYSIYTELMREAETKSMPELSDTLREEYEYLTEQVVELVEEKISPEASLFIAQLLQGQGSLPFDIIASHIIEAKASL